MILTLDNFDQIYNSILLVQDNELTRVRVEITMNYPHTAPWERTSFEDKSLAYGAFFHKLIRMYQSYIIGSDWNIEKTHNNHCHLHGYIDYAFDISENFGYDNFRGLVINLVQVYLQCLPKRYNHPLRGAVYEQWDDFFNRICLPQCCFTMRCMADRKEEWENYIAKNII